jgi:DNA-binding NarL/FixJ family response regulator
VLADIGMAEMDGLEMAKSLRQDPAFNDTLLAAVTGFTDDQIRREAREGGFDEFFIKPADPEVIREWLEAVACEGRQLATAVVRAMPEGMAWPCGRHASKEPGLRTAKGSSSSVGSLKACLLQKAVGQPEAHEKSHRTFTNFANGTKKPAPLP